MARSSEHDQVLAIAASATLASAAKAMREGGVGALVVLGPEGQLAGIVTDRDLLRRAVAASGDPRALSVAEVMSAPVITAPAGAGDGELLARMRKHAVRRLPLVDEQGGAVAMVSFDDLVAVFADLAGEVGRDLREQTRSARRMGQIEHLRDEVDQGLHEIYASMQRANWTARETLLQEFDAFRSVRHLLRGD